MKGTPLFAGFYSTTQRPIEEAYLNNGATWENEAEALANIPSGARYIGQFVNIQNDLYWFLDDLTTLTSVKDALKPKASEVLIDDTTNVFAAENVENALLELMTALITISKKLPIFIVLPPGASIAERLATATIPVNFELSAVGDNGKNLQIIHPFEGQGVHTISVKAFDGADGRTLVPFRDAYSGITENAETIIIEGLAGTLNDLALVISIIFY